MGLRSVSLFAIVLAMTLQNAYGFSESMFMKMKNCTLPHLMECAKEMNITKEMLEEYQKMKSIDEKACFLACNFKKAGVLDEDGMYVAEEAQKLAKEIGEGESEEDAKMLEERTLKCATVNDESVKDGKKGCDRAILIFKCMQS